jgi:VWFA-related protein
MRVRHVAGLQVWLGLAALSAAAQVAVAPARKPQSPPAAPAPGLRVDSNLVLVPTSVYDRSNRPIGGLGKQSFRIFDDGVEQAITHFSMDDEPLAVGLVFDVSGSMGPGLRRSRFAAHLFFETANPEDEFCLVEFADRPKLVTPLTQSLANVKDELVFTRSSGSTALVDAAVLGLNELKKSSKSRKALLIVSDGGENNSRYTLREMRNMVRETDALIYAILVRGRGGTPEETDGPWFLKQMTEDSGGRVLPSEMEEAVIKVSLELRNRYVLGFSPAKQRRDGRYHRVEVKLVPPPGLRNLHVSWRRGYYAPED